MSSDARSFAGIRNALMEDAIGVAHVRDAFAMEDRANTALSWTKMRINGIPELVMSSFSPKYAREIVGGNPADYLWRTDREFWGDLQIVVAFLDGDMAAIEQGHVICGTGPGAKREAYLNKVDGLWYDFDGEKWSITYKGTLFVRGRGKGVLIGDGTARPGGPIGGVSQ